MSDLQQILDGENTETVETAEPVVEDIAEELPEVTEKLAEKEPDPELKPKTKHEETVPLAAFLELRKELGEVKSMVTPKPQATPAPDVFDDPQGYQKHMQAEVQNVTTAARAEVQNATTAAKLEMSRFMAEEKFGKEAVDAMVAYYNDYPEQTAAFLKAPSPFHAGMAHFNSQRVAKEIGDDPTAFREKMKAELRAEIEADMVAKQARDGAGKFAPSMANVTGTGGGPKTTWSGPTPLTSLIGE
jgi:hypothetical protein